MGQHRYREPTPVIKTLGFVLGALVVAAAAYEFIYRSPGIIQAHVTGKIMGLGIIFMLGPIWLYFRRKK